MTEFEKIIKDGKKELVENLRKVPNNIDEAVYTLGAHDFAKIIKPRILEAHKKEIERLKKEKGDCETFAIINGVALGNNIVDFINEKIKKKEPIRASEISDVMKDFFLRFERGNEKYINSRLVEKDLEWKKRIEQTIKEIKGLQSYSGKKQEIMNKIDEFYDNDDVNCPKATPRAVNLIIDWIVGELQQTLLSSAESGDTKEDVTGSLRQFPCSSSETEPEKKRCRK